MDEWTECRGEIGDYSLWDFEDVFAFCTSTDKSADLGTFIKP